MVLRSIQGQPSGDFFIIVAQSIVAITLHALRLDPMPPWACTWDLVAAGSAWRARDPAGGAGEDGRAAAGCARGAEGRQRGAGGERGGGARVEGRGRGGGRVRENGVGGALGWRSARARGAREERVLGRAISHLEEPEWAQLLEGGRGGAHGA